MMGWRESNVCMAQSNDFSMGKRESNRLPFLTDGCTVGRCGLAREVRVSRNVPV